LCKFSRKLTSLKKQRLDTFRLSTSSTGFAAEPVCLACSDGSSHRRSEAKRAMTEPKNSLFKEFFVACWETIKLPFWMIKVGWARLLAFGPKRIGLVLMATVVVTVIAMTAFVKVTSQPTFCKSCHVMEPYFAAWETSTHSQVTCTECHIPPGFEGTVHSKFMALSMVANYFTGVYKRSKPWAEIEDASCLRSGCHDTRLLQSAEDFKGVLFDHKPHLEQVRRDRQLRCTSCHAQIVQGEHISVNETTCFLCHFKPDASGKWSELATCTNCHNPPKGVAASDTSFDHTEMLARNANCSSCHAAEVAGDGFVPKERCNSCHAKVDHIEKYEDREFVHQMHVTEHKVECTQCHVVIRHGKEAVAQANVDRECGTCHGGPENAIERVWEGNLPGMSLAPSSMSRAGMTCSSCHVGDVHAAKEMRPEPTCIPCHDTGYGDLWKRWEEPLKRRVRELMVGAEKLEPASRDSLVAALRIYEAGNPIHNPEMIEKLAMQIEPISARSSSTTCMGCHPSAGDALVAFDGRMFDHRKHTSQSKCETCHEVGGEPHGKLVMSREQCNSCHHQSVATGKEDCSRCHAAQLAVYKGEVKSFASKIPSAMWQEDVSCTDCHEAGKSKVLRDVSASCVTCHDAEYSDSLKVWVDSGSDLMKRADLAVGQYRPGSEIQRQYSELAEMLRKDGSKTVHNPELFHKWFETISTAQ
jgi:nitrate/TMAO reductase-like tetraheme cytochrome c subunit